METAKELFNKGVEAYEQAKYHEAKGYFEQAIALDSNFALPYNGLGAVCYVLKDYAKAIKSYEQAIALDPKFALPYHGLGIVYDQLKEYAKAIESYEQAIALDPNFALPHYGLGNVYDQQKEYSKAIKSYEQAIALDPKFALPYHGLGNVYYQLKEYSKAIVSYKQAIDLAPNLAEPYNSLGLVYYELKEYSKAIKSYEQAIALDSNFALPYNSLGLVYYELNEYSKAITSFEQAISLNLNYPKPYHGLGNVYYELKEYAKAVESYEQAITLDSNFALPHYGLGNVYFKQDEYEKAKQHYLRSYFLGFDDLYCLFLFLSPRHSPRPALIDHLSAYITSKDIRSHASYIATQLSSWQDLYHYQSYLEIQSEIPKWISWVIDFYGGNPLAIAQHEATACASLKEAYLHLLASRELEYMHSCDILFKCHIPKAERYKDSEALALQEPQEAFYAGLWLLEDDEEEQALQCWAYIQEVYPMAALMYGIIKHKNIALDKQAHPIASVYSFTLLSEEDHVLIEQYHHYELLTRYAQQKGVHLSPQEKIWEVFTLEEHTTHRIAGEKAIHQWWQEVAKQASELTGEQKETLSKEIKGKEIKLKRFLKDLDLYTQKEDIIEDIGLSIQAMEFAKIYPQIIYNYYAKECLELKDVFMLLLYEQMQNKANTLLKHTSDTLLHILFAGGVKLIPSNLASFSFMASVPFIKGFVEKYLISFLEEMNFANAKKQSFQDFRRDFENTLKALLEKYGEAALKKKYPMATIKDILPKDEEQKK